MIIFFDFDGTLVDVRNKYYAVYSSFASHFAREPLDRGEFWELKRTRDGDAHILSRSGMGQQPVALFRDYIREHIETCRYLEEDQLFPGVEDLLHQLCTAHRCRIISARRNEQQLLEQIDWLGIRDYFDDILVAPPRVAEAQELTAKALRLKSSVVSPVATMIIGDTEDDIVSGRQLKMKTVAVTSGIRKREYLETLKPDHILASVTEIKTCLESEV